MKIYIYEEWKQIVVDSTFLPSGYLYFRIRKIQSEHNELELK